MAKNCIILSGIISITAFAGPPGAYVPSTPAPSSKLRKPPAVQYEVPIGFPAEEPLPYTSGKNPISFEDYCQEKKKPVFPWKKAPLTLDQERERQHRYLAYLLDQLTMKMEEFGTATVSAPLLTLPDKLKGGDKAPFEFGLNYTADKYYQLNADSVNAAVGSAERTVQSLGIGVGVSNDQIAKQIWDSKSDAFDQQKAIYQGDRLFYEQGQMEKKALYEAQKKALDDKLTADLAVAAALTKPAERLEAEAKARASYATDLKTLTESFYPTTAPAIPQLAYPGATEGIVPTTPSVEVPEPTAARSALKEITAQAALGAVSGADPELPPRTVMVNAYGDKMVQSIFNFLGDPAGAVPFKDKVILFGVSTVSVNPGWRSQKDFAADVSVQCSYKTQEARLETVMRLLKDERYPEAVRKQIAKDYALKFESTTKTKKESAKAALEEQEKVVKAAVSASEKAAAAFLVQTGKIPGLLDEETKLEQQLADLKKEAPEAEFKAALKARLTLKIQELTKQLTQALLTRIDQARALQRELKQRQNQLNRFDTSPPADLATVQTEFVTELQALIYKKEIEINTANLELAYMAKERDKASEKLNAETAKADKLKQASAEADQEAAAEAAKDKENECSKTTACEIYKNAPSWLKQKDLAGFSAPLVAGVSPLMETQNLDLESQWRKQNEFALRLAVLLQEAGLKANAGAFEQYVKNRQSDARSITSSATVSSYSAGGGVFGFQIGPRLQALADPASTKAGQGRVLERQAFPVLVIFGMDRQDVLPTVAINDEKLVVMENAIQFEQVSRWTHMLLPLHHRFHLFKPTTWEQHNRWSEEDRFEWTLYLQKTIRALKPVQELAGENSIYFEEGALQSRFAHFISLANSTKTWISTPVDIMLQDDYQKKAPEQPKAPKVASFKQIFPSELVLGPDDPANPKASFVITGSNLDVLDLSADPAQLAKFVHPPGFFTISDFGGSSKEAVVINGTLGLAAGNGGGFILPVKAATAAESGQERVFSPFIRIKIIQQAEREVETTLTSGDEARTRLIRTTGNVTEATLQQAIQAGGEKPKKEEAAAVESPPSTIKFEATGTLKKTSE